ncbi:hypothetical protein FDECE_10093, partial [Fusarium decemcellulare]
MSNADGMQTTAIKAVFGAGAFVCPALWSAPLHGVTSLLGFGNTIAGGSLAAAWQSSIGNVAALSPFAILQSFGPGGYGTAVINGVVQGAGAVLGGEGIWSLVSEWVNEAGTQDDDRDMHHSPEPCTMGFFLPFAAFFASVLAPVQTILGFFGFTTAGIQAGSMAALIHSWIGNVGAGSLFATLQSAGMGGYGLAAMTCLCGYVGAALAARQFAKDRPVSTACVGIGALAIAAPALAAGPALAMFGFKTSGIASSSIAAGAQKGIGSVIAPSVFSTLQSAGAGGYGVASVYGAVQGAGAALGIGGLSGFFEGRRMIKKDNGNNKKSRSD